MANNTDIEVSVVVPLLNEAESLRAFADRLVGTLDKSAAAWEVILVDDGSTDETYDVIAGLAQANGHIAGLRFSRNFGKEAAILAGLHETRGRCAVVLDGDGQHPPELIAGMLDIWRQRDGDIVSGVKDKREVENFVARTLSKFFNAVMYRLTGIDLINASDFKLLDRKVIDALINLPEKKRFFRGLTAWIGFRQAKVTFVVEKRLGGRSKWSTKSLITLAVSAVTSFSYAPLIWIFYLGIIGFGFSLIMLAAAIYTWVIGDQVSTLMALTVIVLLFGSVQLLSSGLIGIYLARVYEETKQRKDFIVAERTTTK